MDRKKWGKYGYFIKKKTRKHHKSKLRKLSVDLLEQFLNILLNMLKELGKIQNLLKIIQTKALKK